MRRRGLAGVLWNGFPPYGVKGTGALAYPQKRNLGAPPSNDRPRSAPLGVPLRVSKKGKGTVGGPQKRSSCDPAENGLFKPIIDSAGGHTGHLRGTPVCEGRHGWPPGTPRERMRIGRGGLAYPQKGHLRPPPESAWRQGSQRPLGARGGHLFPPFSELKDSASAGPLGRPARGKQGRRSQLSGRRRLVFRQPSGGRLGSGAAGCAHPTQLIEH
jgi:hypothetical protein